MVNFILCGLIYFMIQSRQLFNFIYDKYLRQDNLKNWQYKKRPEDQYFTERSQKTEYQ